MKDFRPPYSWSYSKLGMYNQCQRKYYLNYYGSINGWSKDGTEMQKKLYMLKYMSNRFALSGTMIHDVVAQIFKNFVADFPMQLNHSIDYLVKKLQDAYKESKDEKWKISPKNNWNLEEHYFKQNISKEQWIEFRENAITNIKGFYDLDYYENIKKIPQSNWYTIDKLDKFNYYDTECYAAPDFAYLDNKKFIVIDWKSGKPSPSHEMQLLVYAFYAKNKWDIDYSNMELHDVYLKERKVVKARSIEENIPTVEYLIKSNIDEIKGKLTDINRNMANKEDFAMTDNKNQCKFCKFKEICHPDNYKEL